MILIQAGMGKARWTEILLEGTESPGVLHPVPINPDYNLTVCFVLEISFLKQGSIPWNVLDGLSARRCQVCNSTMFKVMKPNR
jgi:hypothetical protein